MYGLGVSAGLYFFSPYLNLLLGNQYTEAENILRFSSGIVVLQAIQFPLADFLNISGHLQLRSSIQVSTFLLSIFLNIGLIPIFSWSGSLIALYTSTIVCLVALTSTAFYINRGKGG